MTLADWFGAWRPGDSLKSVIPLFHTASYIFQASIQYFGPNFGQVTRFVSCSCQNIFVWHFVIWEVFLCWYKLNVHLGSNILPRRSILLSMPISLLGTWLFRTLDNAGISRGEFELVVKRSSSYFTIIVIQIAIYIVNKTWILFSTTGNFYIFFSVYNQFIHGSIFTITGFKYYVL